MALVASSAFHPMTYKISFELQSSTLANPTTVMATTVWQPSAKGPSFIVSLSFDLASVDTTTLVESMFVM